MPLTIVMYHYVRDLARSRFPGIKGRTIDQFRGQLDHLARHYEIVTAQQVIAAAAGGEALPANACWLTFDDGYLDHYTNVFPLLDERGWQGSFFIPAEPVLEGRLLDVNKIHFLLAAEPDTARLIEALRGEVAAARADGAELGDWDDYVRDHMGECHLDTPQVLFVKSMLQVGLPEEVRNRICDALFARFVSADEAAFAAELYASSDQIKAMVRAGMFVGSHGHAHYWLPTLAAEQQEQEIAASLDFLRFVGMPERDWVMCYPHGAYDEVTLEILRRRGCALGLTTKAGVAQLPGDPPLELPRVDTIDLPVG
jgi:peptidoglycan/xylan/chitin deacetylase (PgdA/CDA1 family)